MEKSWTGEKSYFILKTIGVTLVVMLDHQHLMIVLRFNVIASPNKMFLARLILLLHFPVVCVSNVIFSFVEEQKKLTSAVLEEGVLQDQSSLFPLRGQVLESRCCQSSNHFRSGSRSSSRGSWRSCATTGRGWESRGELWRKQPGILSGSPTHSMKSVGETDCQVSNS